MFISQLVTAMNHYGPNFSLVIKTVKVCKNLHSWNLSIILWVNRLGRWRSWLLLKHWVDLTMTVWMNNKIFQYIMLESHICSSFFFFLSFLFFSFQSELGTQSQLRFCSGRTAGNERYRCSACGKHYVHQSSFVRHRNMECGKEPRFQCPYCPKKSKRKSNIAAHIKCKHMRSLHFF